MKLNTRLVELIITEVEWEISNQGLPLLAAQVSIVKEGCLGFRNKRDKKKQKIMCMMQMRQEDCRLV